MVPSAGVSQVDGTEKGRGRVFESPAVPIPSRAQPGPTKNKLSTRAVVICFALAATISAAALIYANILAQRYGLPPVRISESIGLGGLLLLFSFRSEERRVGKACVST